MICIYMILIIYIFLKQLSTKDERFTTNLSDNYLKLYELSKISLFIYQ